MCRNRTSKMATALLIITTSWSAGIVWAQRPPGEIMNLYSKKCLDVPWGSGKEHVVIQQYACQGSDNQRWKFRPTGEILNIKSGLCLDVPWGSSDDGISIQQFKCQASANQRWEFGKAGELVNFRSHKCLDILSGSKDDHAKLIQSACNGSESQKWRVPLPSTSGSHNAGGGTDNQQGASTKKQEGSNGVGQRLVLNKLILCAFLAACLLIVFLAWRLRKTTNPVQAASEDHQGPEPSPVPSSGVGATTVGQSTPVVPRTRQQALEYAKQLYNRGLLHQSASLFDRLTADKDTCADAHYGLGLVNFAKGRYVSATSNLLEATRADNHNANAHYYLGAVLDKRGYKTLADQHYREALLIDPHHQAAAVRLRQERHSSENESMARTQSPAQSTRREPLSTGSKTWMERSQNQKALEYAKEIYRQGKLDLSAQIFDRLTLDKATRGEALYCLGLVNLAKGRYVSATANLADASKAYPDSANGQYYLGVVLEKRGYRTRAQQCYKRALKINPRHHAARERLEHTETANRSHAHSHAGKNRQVSASAMSAATARVRDTEQTFADAIRAYQHGKLDLSAQIFDRLTLDKKKRTVALYCLGLVNLAKGRYVSATANFVDASRAYPKSANVQYYLGAVLEKRGFRIRAEQYYKRALQINPHHHGARERLGYRPAKFETASASHVHTDDRKIQKIPAPSVSGWAPKFRDDNQALSYAKRVYQQGKLDLSSQIFDRLTLDKHSRAEALYCLGLVNLAQKRPVSAARFLLAAIEADPNNRGARDYFELALKGLGVARAA